MKTHNTDGASRRCFYPCVVHFSKYYVVALTEHITKMGPAADVFIHVSFHFSKYYIVALSEHITKVGPAGDVFIHVSFHFSKYYCTL